MAHWHKKKDKEENKGLIWTLGNLLGRLALLWLGLWVLNQIGAITIQIG